MLPSGVRYVAHHGRPRRSPLPGGVRPVCRTRESWQGHPAGYRCGVPGCELDRERDDRMALVRANWLMLLDAVGWRCQSCRARLWPRWLPGFRARLSFTGEPAVVPSHPHLVLRESSEDHPNPREVLYFGEDRRTPDDYLEVVRVLCRACYSSIRHSRKEVISVGKKSGAGNMTPPKKGGAMTKSAKKHGKC